MKKEKDEELFLKELIGENLPEKEETDENFFGEELEHEEEPFEHEETFAEYEKEAIEKAVFELAKVLGKKPEEVSEILKKGEEFDELSEKFGKSKGDSEIFEKLAKMRGISKEEMKEEILSTIGENEESVAFANSVFDRFKNPFIQHKWRAIALNSVSKFSVRVLPTLLEYKEKKNKLPKCLTLSLANLIYFYKNDCPEDAPDVVETMKNDSIEDILKNEALWGNNLSDMTETIIEYYNKIDTIGAKEAMKWILSE